MTQIELKNISKKYDENTIFENLNLIVQQGEFLGIKGESGKGKSTLLNIIGMLETCTGEIIIDGETVDTKNSKQVNYLLQNKIGYLFQNFALIDDQTLYSNLEIVIPKKSKAEKKALINEQLKRVGLTGDILKKKICKFSGGEQQRIAVARLMLKKASIILADEPTGSLDNENGKLIMSLLKELNDEGKTIIMVTHDDRNLKYCSRVIEL